MSNESLASSTPTRLVAAYAAGARERSFPPEIIDEARKCLVDWTAVCVGAYGFPEATKVQAVMRQWDSHGKARFLSGGSASAPAVAMVNGTLSHCLDYDDTHIPSLIHVSAPLWAALLAVGADRGIAEALLLKAFVAGFEIAARIGDNGVGLQLNNSGWHATATLARLGVAAGVGCALGLNERQLAHAIGIAATQAGGLTASFGTMAKPFHVGKTAMDGILAAQLAAEGFEGSDQVLDTPTGLIGTLLQDAAASLQMAPFDAGWEIQRNSFKPYAACQLTHGAIDAARAARAAVADRPIERIRAEVNPLVLKIAGVREARSPTEGKFSTGFCVALGLRGYPVTTQDFTLARLADATLQDIARRVELVPTEDVSRTAARLQITLANGEQLNTSVEYAFGSIGNPMGWRELDAKFMALVAPKIGGEANASALLAVLHGFERPGSLARMFDLTASSAA